MTEQLNPRYLTEKEAIILNAAVIKKYTPKEQVGVKDTSLLLSALGRPQQTVFGDDAYPTIFGKAAALYASISQNHAFHNGNKRTGFACMKQFLWLNGYQFLVNQKEAEDYTVFIVEEKPSIEDIAKWLKDYSTKR
ncbi:type II toxin-antitoxin system death-on-curing family toxin [Oceanobacillus sp. CFH 90083]|uniref:type II toxin-antitoxin system death-on-curing family toxin n=1 Tax=Oceanobacillus sp. CFH 90083 TaxID=2592336 RepID=UPI00128B61B6|nr:type II toxin-antitoxin system death-on-curing family toxin [Oceanobacillus sp. CFH 90083]